MFDRLQLYRFEDFVADTTRVTNGDELFGLLRRAVGQYGYDRLIFSIFSDPDLPYEMSGHGLMHAYPEDWQKEYNEKNYARLDPVMRAASTHSYAFTWEELERTSNYTNEQVRFMRLAEEAGLKSGIGIPIKTGRAMIAGVGLASSDRHDGGQAHLDLLNAFCTQFHTAYKRLHEKPRAETGGALCLSAKEAEILTWVAAGKTDDDIGTILGISRNTVDTHMRNIFRKLDAPNRVAAVVRGIVNGHIRP